MAGGCKPGPWKWALNDADISKSAHHVALTIAVRFNNNGEVPETYRVSMSTLARNAKMKRDTVIAAVAELEDAGWLGVDRGQGTRASRYWCLRPSLAVPLTVPLEMRDDELAVPFSDLAVPQTGASGPSRGTLSPLSTLSPRADFNSQEMEDLRRQGFSLNEIVRHLAEKKSMENT